MCRAIRDGGRRCAHVSRQPATVRALARAEAAAEQRAADAAAAFGPPDDELAEAYRQRDTDPAGFRAAVARRMPAWRRTWEWVRRSLDRLHARREAMLPPEPDAPINGPEQSTPTSATRTPLQVLASLTAAEAELDRCRRSVAVTEGGISTRDVWAAEAEWLDRDLREAEAALRPPGDLRPDARGLPRPRMRRVTEIRLRRDRLVRWLSETPADHETAIRDLAIAESRLTAARGEWDRMVDGA